MKTIIIISAIFLLTSCSIEKSTDFKFFKGAWLSDSVYTVKNDHWREFIYFDSLGTFNRTTFWGQNYLLSQNLILKDSSIYENGKELFKIHVIDSNNIILKGGHYYGSFNRDPFQNIGSWEEDLKNTRLSDRNRKIFLGTWKFYDYHLVNNDTLQMYPQEFLKTKDFKHFRYYKINDKLTLTLDFNYFYIKSDSAETKFNYIINPEKIEISKSDYIIGIQYKLNEDTLTIYDSPMYQLTNVIRFIRK